MGHSGGREVMRLSEYPRHKAGKSLHFRPRAGEYEGLVGAYRETVWSSPLQTQNV